MRLEVTNSHWLEYLYWLDRVYAADYPEIYKKALPDTLVWRSKLAFNGAVRGILPPPPSVP
jgi:hypothetical protein